MDKNVDYLIIGGGPSITNTGSIYGKIPQYSKVQLNCENGEIIIL